MVEVGLSVETASIAKLMEDVGLAVPLFNVGVVAFLVALLLPVS